MKLALPISMGLAILLLNLSPVRQSEGAQTMHGHNEFLVYVGSAIYEHGTAKNIYVFRFNAATGSVSSPEVAVESVNPGGLAVHPNGRFLYSTNEVGDHQKFAGGGVTSYVIDRTTGKLTILNRQPTGGANPSYVFLDKTARYLVTSNYYGGTVAVFPVRDDGSLGPVCSTGHSEGSGPNKVRQDGPHPHSVYISPDNRFVIACDLGSDKVVVYRFDAKTGTVTPNDPPFARVPSGAGSRHLAFSRDGKFIYVMNELQSSITTFAYDGEKGVLRDRGTISALPPDFKGENSGAEIAVSNSGKFLYSSNRGLNSIAVFAIDTASSKLTQIEQAPTTGRMPRAFALDPTGQYLFVANEASNNIVLFRVDAKTGRVTPTGQVLPAVAPTFVAIVPL